jgi:PAT family beta-lactamase induction signal transducer AmpG
VPTLYFAEGLPYVIVNIVSVAMYTKMDIPNTLIGLTSSLYLPWVVKPLWGQLWISFHEAALDSHDPVDHGHRFRLVGAILHLPSFFGLSLVLFTLIAFTSATHDIATDGFTCWRCRKIGRHFLWAFARHFTGSR